jgi:hypothetical protein
MKERQVQVTTERRQNSANSLPIIRSATQMYRVMAILSKDAAARWRAIEWSFARGLLRRTSANFAGEGRAQRGDGYDILWKKRKAIDYHLNVRLCGGARYRSEASGFVFQLGMRQFR